MATDNSATSGVYLPWAGKKVHQEQVEEELTRLWHLAADNMRISQNMNVRTSVLNFVICTRGTESAHKVSTLLRELSSTNIARVTLVILDTSSGAPADISCWVTLRSFPIISDMMRHHFEQITVDVRGAAIQYAANAVQPLLKPDLPVYLLWMDDIPDNDKVFQNFLSLSNRVIVDSSSFPQPEKRLRTIEHIVQQMPNCALSDLTWSRITALRELIAQFFDVPEYRPYLMGVNHITIEYTAINTPAHNGHMASSSASPTALGSLFLAAWLKSRLGWQRSDRAEDNQHDTLSGSYGWYMEQRDMTRVTTPLAPLSQEHQGGADTTPSVGIQFIVRPRELEDSEPGTIILVRMHTTAQGQEAAFTIERGDDDDHVITSAELPDNTHPSRTVNVAATHKESELLHNELEIMGRDHLYEETVKEVLALLT